jgi:hypothetical protein
LTLRITTISALAGLWFLALAGVADAHLIASPKNDTLAATLASQQRNLAHVRYVCNNGAGEHKRFSCPWVKILVREIATTKARMRPSKMELAWAWYRTPATQCVCDHEGGWTSVGPTAHDGSYYAGRFQKDASFERETAFGRRMQARYGRSIHWPPWAQVFQAYEVWSYAGWSRWPTYAKYCA